MSSELLNSRKVEVGRSFYLPSKVQSYKQAILEQHTAKYVISLHDVTKVWIETVGSTRRRYWVQQPTMI